MQKNTLYLLLGALLVVVVGLGVSVYQEESKPSGVEMRIDQNGLQIEEN